MDKFSLLFEVRKLLCGKINNNAVDRLNLISFI